MMDRPANCQQLDLLVHVSKALEQNRLLPKIRVEVTVLVKLLMAECIAVSAAQPIEAADE
ncbi:MAG: hypothetical protein ACJ8AH_21760 [Stellaceae bacterium]|jgi:hypothetical protein